MLNLYSAISSSKPEPKKTVLVNNLCNTSWNCKCDKTDDIWALNDCWEYKIVNERVMRHACVGVCVCEWQLVHMVPEVEKHIIPPSMSSQPCRIEEPGHRVSSILFNLNAKAYTKSYRRIAKSSRYLDCRAVSSLLHFFFFRTFHLLLASPTTDFR